MGVVTINPAERAEGFFGDISERVRSLEIAAARHAGPKMATRLSAALNNGTATGYTIFDTTSFVAPYSGWAHCSFPTAYGFSGAGGPSVLAPRLHNVTDGVDIAWHDINAQRGVATWHPADLSIGGPIIAGKTYAFRWYYYVTGSNIYVTTATQTVLIVPERGLPLTLS